MPYGDNKEVGKYININGVQHYYEVYGTGKPVLVMSCDRDVIKEEHTFFIYKNIPFANLCILPIETHSVAHKNPDLFNAMVDKFLSQPFKGNAERFNR